MDRSPFQLVSGGRVLLWGDLYGHRVDLPRAYTMDKLLPILDPLFADLGSLSPGEVGEEVLAMLEVDRVFGGDPSEWGEEGEDWGVMSSDDV